MERPTGTRRDGWRRFGGSNLRRRLLSAPRLLLVLTFGVLCHNVAWVVALPAWQGPDESSHYAYVERLAVDHTLMPFDSGSDGPSNSDATNSSLGGTGFNELRFRYPLRPFGAAGADNVHFLREVPGLPQHNYGELGANKYPPAYYVAALPFFELPWLSRATEREYTIRLLSALLGALLVPLTYRLARSAALSVRASLIAAALATSAPIMTQQSAVFSPDVLLVVAITGLADACLRARSRIDRRPIGRVVAWGALAALTKPIGLPAAAAIVAPIAILTLADVARRTRIALLAGCGVAGVLLGSYFASTFFGIAPAHSAWLARLKFTGEYLWQYYLPRPSAMPLIVPPATPASPPAAWMWGKEGVGILGWLTTRLPEWAYSLAWTPTKIAGVIALAGGVFGRGRDRSGRSPVLALLVASIAYVLVLHGAEATYLLSNGNRLLQGRYFLPVYPLIAVALMAGLSRFGERFAIAVGFVLLAAWSFVAVDALNTILVYYG
ncbi:MAG: hypothetical protein QOK36_3922 [Gaiellales bacterium]|nr:hypothetical protein [Gaiellales bacterium]